jgi:hypothetical protein
VDNELTPASPVTSSGAAVLLLKTNLTVSASANTLVVVVTFRNGDTTLTEAPATLGWTNGIATPQTLTLAVQAVDKNSHGRGAAIYYFYNPTAGTGFNINGKLSGQGSGGSSGEMVAYTLGGVDTTVTPPPTGYVSNTAPTLPLSFNVSGVTAGSWAAVGGATAITTPLPITASNSAGSTLTGTPVLTTTGADFSSTSTSSEGYISSMLFGGTETFIITESGPSDLTLVAAVFKPSNTSFPFLVIGEQPQSVTIPAGQGFNATFNVSAAGNPAVASYQWYEVIGGATNLIAGATTTSFTTNNPTVSDDFYVVVGNGSTTVTSSVAAVNLYADGTWNTSGGSWNTPGNWVGNLTASGVDATASFTDGLGGTVTLDNAAGFTVGTNIFGINGASTVQPAWVINAGSPAGTLTVAVDTSVPTSVVAGSASPTVTAVPLITVYANNPVTINAPLAGNQGLNVNGGGTLVLAGGNTNSTYSGSTVIGANTSDTTALQIGAGGTSGAIDFTSPIYMCGYGQLIFNRSDTLTVSTYIDCKATKAPNVIVNSGTVIMAPQATTDPYLGAIVNGGTLVLDCPAGVTFINNAGGTVFTDGTPASVTNGAPNGGNSGGIALGINSGGTVRLAGPGGNGVNIQANNGVLDNGSFDLGGDAVQVAFIAGAGSVTNTGATLATLNLSGSAAPFPWNGTIADGTTAQTAVTLSGGTTTFTGTNTYTGKTLLSGTLILSNSASLASANIIVSGANLYLANAPTISNPNATISVGSGRTLDLTGLSGNFTLNAGQTLVVTNTGIVNAGANPITVVAASGSTLVPGGNGTAGTMTIDANLTLNGNTNAFDLATASTEGGGVNDEIVGVTNLTLSGNVTIKVNTSFNNTFNPSTTYRLIKYSGSLANTATFTVIPATLNGNPNTIDTTSQPGYVLLKTGGSSAPILSVLATNIEAFTGYPVTLPVSESGSTPITNQWFIGATPVPGATTANYTFTPATPGVYTYTLYASNAVGHAQASVILTVGSPAISIQCALSTAQFAGSLYLAPTDTAGEYPMSNWNVITITPSTATAAGITSTTLVDSNGFVTPASFTAVNVQDGWHEALTITSSDTANARFMNTYWYANPIGGHTPVENSIVFTFTNLPNDTYNVYVYLLQQVSSGTGGPVEVYDSTITNYVEYGEDFSSLSNFVTAIDTAGTGILPFGNFIELEISTGGTNAISFTESGTVAGVGGSGVTGIQIVPLPPAPPSIIQQPVSQRVITNLPATFTVLANGFPLAYQWYSISRAGVTNILANATNTSYTTPPVQDTNTGTGFFVVVSNYLNQVTSSTAYLTAGHMVTASGLLIDDQFYTAANTPYVFFEEIYPDSTWLAANPPTLTEYLSTFESTNDLPVEPPPFHPEAEQIYGWFTPAMSGDYVFFVTSDDAGALWLSTNASPANSYLIAQNQSYMIDRDWTCSDTGCGEYTGGYYADGEFRSDLFVSGGGPGAYNQYSTGWSATPAFNASDNGIILVAGTPYYIELDNSYAGTPGDNQCAAVTYKLAGNPDPVSGSASLLTSNNISASVPDSVLPAPTPVITTIALVSAGSQVIINATNGLVNAQCNVQTSTNLTQWVTSASGWFDLSGNFSITNAIGTHAPQTFYRLQEVPQ